ncbi:DUF58 domain-containing protein [Xanthocytophaga flava]|uniref:DUF58 domain-containing protein n=1 Tax=Xanthocytophaga flava TaxID=3048013 RepID=UPI0028D3E472|nr:DUF58 domain-containing protein [Xanthocytophaga flavus]MDJ1468100.1 DUF58 domain-containing protein [Xanthocytophaga flavus]
MSQSKNKPISLTQWFTPEELRSLKGLEWLARKVAHEAISGLHGGVRLGQGTDFSQYRTYMPGDDLRRIDWKIFGRTDRLYLKESELESRTRWYGLLDASSSMIYEENGMSKWQYAKILWAAIAFIARQQGDADGLALINDQQVLHLPPKAGMENARMQMLFQADSKGKWPEKIQLPLQQGGFQHKFILITDLYEHTDELGAFIRSLLPARNEVMVFHLMGKKELNLDFSGVTVFEDAETGQQVQTDPNRIRSQYEKQATEFIRSSRDQILKWGANYYLCTIEDSPVSALRAFLKGQSSEAYVAGS